MSNMKMPTQRDIIRAMSLEEYARHIGYDSERAEIFRETLYQLEREGKIYQDENGNWWPVQS